MVHRFEITTLNTSSQYLTQANLLSWMTLFIKRKFVLINKYEPLELLGPTSVVYCGLSEMTDLCLNCC